MQRRIVVLPPPEGVKSEPCRSVAIANLPKDDAGIVRARGAFERQQNTKSDADQRQEPIQRHIVLLKIASVGVAGLLREEP
jgi:hypothetical protein